MTRAGPPSSLRSFQLISRVHQQRFQVGARSRIGSDRVDRRERQDRALQLQFGRQPRLRSRRSVVMRKLGRNVEAYATLTGSRDCALARRLRLRGGCDALRELGVIRREADASQEKARIISVEDALLARRNRSGSPGHRRTMPDVRNIGDNLLRGGGRQTAHRGAQHSAASYKPSAVITTPGLFHHRSSGLAGRHEENARAGIPAPH